MCLWKFTTNPTARLPETEAFVEFGQEKTNALKLKEEMERDAIGKIEKITTEEKKNRNCQNCIFFKTGGCVYRETK